MPRVRRINVSQIEGNSANDSNESEIRPFGEAGFYINEDGNTNTVELLMFDGERTHLKSKVLGNGILYGANLDGGDGLNTIKLVPDADTFRNGSNQYIVVDPTAPNHIHLRAGGAIDASSAELYLGGEINNVRVSDSGSVAINTGNSETETNSQWIFDSNGNITFPDGSIQSTASKEPVLIYETTMGPYSGDDVIGGNNVSITPLPTLTVENLPIELSSGYRLFFAKVYWTWSSTFVRSTIDPLSDPTVDKEMPLSYVTFPKVDGLYRGSNVLRMVPNGVSISPQFSFPDTFSRGINYGPNQSTGTTTVFENHWFDLTVTDGEITDLKATVQTEGIPNNTLVPANTSDKSFTLHVKIYGIR
jgi:hypothetical protein